MITARNNSWTEIPLFTASELIILILSCRRDNMNLAIGRSSPSFRPIPLPLPFALPFGTRNESTPVRDTPLTLKLLSPSPAFFSIFEHPSPAQPPAPHPQHSTMNRTTPQAPPQSNHPSPFHLCSSPDPKPEAPWKTH